LKEKKVNREILGPKKVQKQEAKKVKVKNGQQLRRLWIKGVRKLASQSMRKRLKSYE